MSLNLQGNFIYLDFIIPVLWDLYLGVCLVHMKKCQCVHLGDILKLNLLFLKNSKIFFLLDILIGYIACTHACLQIQGSLKLVSQPFILDCSFIFPGSSLDGLSLGRCNLTSQDRE